MSVAAAAQTTLAAAMAAAVPKAQDVLARNPVPLVGTAGVGRGVACTGGGV